MDNWFKKKSLFSYILDEDENQQVEVLQPFLWISLLFVFGTGFFYLPFLDDPNLRWGVIGGFTLLILGGLYLLRKGSQRVASLTFTVSLWGMLTFTAYLSGGVRTASFAS